MVSLAFEELNLNPDIKGIFAKIAFRFSLKNYFYLDEEIFVVKFL